MFGSGIKTATSRNIDVLVMNLEGVREEEVMDLDEVQKEEVMNLEGVRKEEMTYLDNVNKEELPYHARLYFAYLPILEKHVGEKLVFLEGDEALKEIPEDTPIIEIRRARESGDPNDEKKSKTYKIDGPNADKKSKTYKFDDPSVEEEAETFEKQLQCRLVDHEELNDIMDRMGVHIKENKLTIRDFKIFHIWKTIFKMKQHSLPWKAKFQPTTGEIGVEIHSREKTENEKSPTKIADFIIHTKNQDCDKRVTVTVGDCIVEYSLISKAYRVKFEIRAYNDDGSRAHNVSGHVYAVYYCAGGEREDDIFGGENKKLKHMDTLTSCNLILAPDVGYFDLNMSLSDDIGNFVFKKDVNIKTHKVAIDEQHYVVGEKGYILLTIFWACVCADLEKGGGGVCTCPSTVLGNFMEENNGSGEATEDVYSGRAKRAKIRESSSGEDNNSIEDGDFSTC